MATVKDVARLVAPAGDVDAGVRALQAAGLGVRVDGNHLLVGGTVGVQFIGGNVTAVNPYWVVYDVHNPSKSKIKVRGNEAPAAERTPD